MFHPFNVQFEIQHVSVSGLSPAFCLLASPVCPRATPRAFGSPIAASRFLFPLGVLSSRSSRITIVPIVPRTNRTIVPRTISFVFLSFVL